MLHKDCFSFECEIRGKCKCRVTKNTNCEKCNFYKTVDKYNADVEKYKQVQINKVKSAYNKSVAYGLQA